MPKRNNPQGLSRSTQGETVSTPATQLRPQLDFNPSIHQPASLSVSAMAEMSHSGPLPHPSVLRQYNELMPGLGERIVRMAENQSAHRMDLERQSLNAEIQANRNQVLLSACGQISSFVVAMTAIFAAAYVALRGQPWVGGIVGTGGLGGLIVAIIQAVKKSRSDDEK